MSEERQGEPAEGAAVRDAARHATSVDASSVHASSVHASSVHATIHPASVHAASVRHQGVWEAVADLVHQRRSDLGRPLRVLDLGGGTGGLAVPLAELGHEITVVDPSPNALATLERRAAEFGVADRITARQGDADSLADLRSGHGTPAAGYGTSGTARGWLDGTITATHTTTATESSTATADTAGIGDTAEAHTRYDLVCCHGVLEVVDDPAKALTGIASVLAPAGHLSLLVAGRLAVVLAKALAGELVQAKEALTSVDGRWGRSDPLPRRFDLAELTILLEQSGLRPQQIHGVRIFTDLVPSSAFDSSTDRAALADLERAVATHPHYADTLGNLGAGLHAIAQRT